MTSQELFELVTRAMQGNSDAFVELCQRYMRNIHYMAYQIVTNEQDAQDVTQEVLLEMHKNLCCLQSAYGFVAWMSKITVNKSYDLLRKKHNMRSDIDIQEMEHQLKEERPANLPEEFAQAGELRDALLGSVGELPVNTRSVMLMHYYQSLSRAEIAQVMGIPIHAVYAHLSRGRKLLKAAMKRMEEEGKIDLGHRSFSVSVLSAVFLAHSLELFPEKRVSAVLENMPELHSPLQAAPRQKKKSFTLFKIGCMALIGTYIVVSINLWLLPPSTSPTMSLPDSPLPMSSLPDGFASMVPQPSDVRPEGTGGLEIDFVTPTLPPGESRSPGGEGGSQPTSGAVAGGGRTPSPAPSTTPRPSSTAVIASRPPEPLELSPAGRIALLDLQGREIADPQADLGGLVVRLLDSEGKTLYTTATDAAGIFSFSTMILDANQKYTIALVLGSGRPFAPTGTTPSAKVSLSPKEMQTGAYMGITLASLKPQIFVPKGACECGHVNPESIVLNDLGAYVTQQWTLSAGGQLLLAGSSPGISQQELETLPYGAYELQCSYVDEAGNQAQLQYNFLRLPSYANFSQYK